MYYSYKRILKILRGPANIFGAIVISVSTYYFYKYSNTCWVTTDFFCLTIENSKLLFKWIIAVTQLVGIGLLLWDLDKRMQTLTSGKLITYFYHKVKNWIKLFGRVEQHSSGMGSITAVARSEMYGYSREQKATIEGQLEYLLKKINESEVNLAKETNARKKLEMRLDSDIERVKKVIAESTDQVMDKVKSVHVNGYTLQLWSMFLIAYSAILGVFI